MTGVPLPGAPRRFFPSHSAAAPAVGLDWIGLPPGAFRIVLVFSVFFFRRRQEIWGVFGFWNGLECHWSDLFLGLVFAFGSWMEFVPVDRIFGPDAEPSGTFKSSGRQGTVSLVSLPQTPSTVTCAAYPRLSPSSICSVAVIPSNPRRRLTLLFSLSAAPQGSHGRGR